jgi:hypothetical protein
MDVSRAIIDFQISYHTYLTWLDLLAHSYQKIKIKKLHEEIGRERRKGSALRTSWLSFHRMKNVPVSRANPEHARMFKEVSRPLFF